MAGDFWELAGEFMADDERLVEGTIMGQPCLRLGKEFVAMAEHKGTRMIVKLDAERVAQLVAAGTAAPFAPAGKTFREWAAVADRSQWKPLLAEAIVKTTP